MPGDEYMILKTYHGKFVHMNGDKNYLKNVNGSIRDWNKFKVHGLGSGKVALETVKGFHCYENDIDADSYSGKHKNESCAIDQLASPSGISINWNKCG